MRPPHFTASQSLRPAGTYKSGDADDAGQLAKWIEGHEIVVDAAAPYPVEVFSAATRGVRNPLFYAERRTRALLHAVMRKYARLAYVGSFVTLGRPRTSAHQIQAKMMRLAHPYFDVKELIESLVLDACRRGLRATIVNPTYCRGPWDLRDRKLCTVPLLLTGEIRSSIRQRLNVIDVRDVADALLASPAAERHAHPLLLSGYDISTQELYSLICELGGLPPPPVSVATGFALGSEYLMELMFAAIGRKTPLPSGGIMMSTAFDYLDDKAVLRELGVTPRPLNETITDAIR
ncbi:MAG: hypothetical protein ACREQN_15100 [Candidatus Binataceae bacterium]